MIGLTIMESRALATPFVSRFTDVMDEIYAFITPLTTIYVGNIMQPTTWAFSLIITMAPLTHFHISHILHAA